MISRTNQVLSLALIVQIIVGIVLFIPDDSDASGAAGPLLAEFEPDKVVSLTIQDSNDNTVVLRKTDEDEWVLPDKGDYPIQSTRIEELLNGLQAISRNRLIAHNASSHGRLGVSSNKYERLLKVELADGDTHAIYVGTSAGASAAHVRLEDEDNVYLTSELVAWEIPARVGSWINTTYFSVTRDAITTLQIENANGVYQLQKTGDDWTLVGLTEDETFDPESVTSLLSSVSTIRMTEPLGKEADPAWNMDEPVATITLTVEETVPASEAEDETDTASPSIDDLLPSIATPEAEDTSASATPEAEPDAAEATAEPEPETVEKLYVLTLGQQLEDNGYPLISSESEFYVKVSAATAEKFVNLTREDFLVTESETEDEAASPDATATSEPDSDTD